MTPKEDMYPSLFANLTKQLKIQFVDRDLLADMIKQYSLGLYFTAGTFFIFKDHLPFHFLPYITSP